MRGAKQKEMGGGGTLIFSCKRRLWLFWGVQILNFNILGVFRKLNIFEGMKILLIFFGVITKVEHTIHLRVFSEGQGIKWRIFFWLLKFKYLFGVLEILDIFLGVNGRCWARAYV